MADNPTDPALANVAQQAEMAIEPENMNVAPILSVIGIMLVFVISAVLVTMSLVDVEYQERLLESTMESGYPELQAVRAIAAEALTQYGVVEGDTNVYKIPIDRAMLLLVNDAAGTYDTGTFTDQVTLLPQPQ
ncbi:MAG: hypothetical protein AAGJ10_16550 [Bacteroidota bacterium]